MNDLPHWSHGRPAGPKATWNRRRNPDATRKRQARERGFRQALLHAQTYVKEFYAQAGYTEHGEVFMEADIEHIAMTKDLTRAL